MRFSHFPVIRYSFNVLLIAAVFFSVVHARAFFPESNSFLSNGLIDSPSTLQTSLRTSKIPKSVIKFAVFGGKAKLYVNGKKQNTKPGSFNKLELSLNKNDVIAFKCSKTGSPSKMAGLMASITHNGKVYRTGLSRFTTRGDFSKWNTWEKQSWDKLKLYNDKKSGAKHDFCHWKQAHIVASKWNKFDTKASFIWRLTGKQTKQAARSVFIRFVVGGEMCSGDQRTGGTPKNDDDEDDDSEGKGKKTRKGDDDDGDNDDDEGKSKKKGRKDDENDDDDDDDDERKSKKKGRKDDGDDDDDDGEDKSKKKSSDVDDDDDDERKSKKKRSNKDDDDDEGDDDQKDRKKSTKKDNEDNDDDEHNKPSGRVPHPKDDDDDDNDKKHKYGDESELRGQSDESKPDHFCACQLTTRRGGECYDMEDNTASSGRCRPRPCEPKFECVASGDKMCVKRRGGTKVVMVSPNNCKVETADDIEMLLPYEG